MDKLERLKAFVRDKGREGVIVSFSGGVDSTTLALVCREVVDVVAVTVDSEVLPRRDLKDAIEIAKRFKLEHHVLNISLLSDENFVKNNEDRCYFCKKRMIKALKEFGRKIGVETIFEGTNASDLKGHRPGYRAVIEENVYSPWVEFGFTKEEIVAIAKRLGVPIKSSTTCLATRIPFGESITLKRLRRIEKSEEVLRDVLGVEVVRVRDHGDTARIEVEKNDMTKFFDLEVMERVAKILKSLGYRYVTLDLEGYRAT